MATFVVQRKHKGSVAEVVLIPACRDFREAKQHHVEWLLSQGDFMTRTSPNDEVLVRQMHSHEGRVFPLDVAVYSTLFEENLPDGTE